MFEDTIEVSIGAVIRNSSGEIMAVMSEKISKSP